MLVSTPKKKRGREAELCSVVSSQEGVLQLLKRIRPSLRPDKNRGDDSNESDDGQEESDGKGECPPRNRDGDFPGSVTIPRRGMRRAHSRTSDPWTDGRKYIALGINECTRLLERKTSVLCTSPPSSSSALSHGGGDTVGSDKQSTPSGSQSLSESSSPSAAAIKTISTVSSSLSASLAPPSSTPSSCSSLPSPHPSSVALSLKATVKPAPAKEPLPSPQSLPPPAHVVLICRGARPQHMVEHLVGLAKRKKCPCLIIPLSSAALGASLGLKTCIALAVKNLVVYRGGGDGGDNEHHPSSTKLKLFASDVVALPRTGL